MNFTRENLENAFEAGRECERDVGDSFEGWFYKNFVSVLPKASFTIEAENTFRWKEKEIFDGRDVKTPDLDDVK